MPDFIVGIRHGAADRATIEAAGFRVVRDTFAGYESLEPQRHYVRLTATDEADAAPQIVASLGWENWGVAFLITRPSARPCADQ